MNHRDFFKAGAQATTLGAIAAGDSSASKTFPAEQLRRGVNLAAEFPANPFNEAFARVDAALTARQSYETQQVKKVFHGVEGKADLAGGGGESDGSRARAAGHRDSVGLHARNAHDYPHGGVNRPDCHVRSRILGEWSAGLRPGAFQSSRYQRAAQELHWPVCHCPACLQ